MPKLSGTDCVAIVLIVCCCALILFGHNSYMEYIMGGIAAAYGFGKVARQVVKK